ncbi:MAG: ferredoxin-type protein NapF [Planctomycetes bacterium]|nr:ferredoxin-type protein NapF [Planctomycetota bacterium]
MNPSRRAWLRGTPARPSWLPWSDPSTVQAECVRCGACVTACPARVIRTGDGGFPTVDAALGECTFCGACAAACPAPVFDRDCTPPWPLRAVVADDCLETRGIACRACEDACPTAALRFRPAPGGRANVAVDDTRCTGCGACVSRCPAHAITVGAPRPAARLPETDHA